MKQYPLSEKQKRVWDKRVANYQAAKEAILVTMGNFMEEDEIDPKTVAFDLSTCELTMVEAPAIRVLDPIVIPDAPQSDAAAIARRNHEMTKTANGHAAHQPTA